MEKKHLSATQLNMFLRCPRQYEFRYIKGFKIPPSGAMVQSRVWHETLEANYKQKVQSDKDLPLSDMVAIGETFDGEKSLPYMFDTILRMYIDEKGRHMGLCIKDRSSVLCRG